MSDTPPSAAQVYAAAQAAIAFGDTYIDQSSSWWTTAADGGFHADGTPTTGAGDPLAGFVPMTNPAGVTTYLACRAKLVAGLTPASIDQRILRRAWLLRGGLA